MFSKVLQSVMVFLGVQNFAKNEEGKSYLTEEQEKQLSDKFGAKFVESFKSELTEFEAGEAQAQADAALLAQIKKENEDYKAELSQMKAALEIMKATQVRLQEENEKLAKQPGEQDGAPVANQEGENKMRFTPDMSMAHNQAIRTMAAGRSYTGDTTVDTQELQKEFGRYVSADKAEIFNKLVGPLDDTKEMTTIITDKFELRASYATINSVLQSFVPQWTAKGASKFTPLTIKQYPMKINVPIVPSDIIDEILGYLYDEKLKPEDMPIVRYIVEKLVKPTLDEERQTAMAVGVYKEPEANESGVFSANEANQVMDGYMTQLCDLKKAGNSKVNFINCDKAFPTASAEIVKFVEDFCDAVSPNYKNKVMTIKADPDLVVKYSRAYRDVFKETKNADGEKVRVDYTKFSFVPMEGMRGTGAFFITPKENFKHVMSAGANTKNLRMEHADYTAKVFGEWREGVGFWIQEAIFAYIPAALVSELAPTSVSEGDGKDGL